MKMKLTLDRSDVLSAHCSSPPPRRSDVREPLVREAGERHRHLRSGRSLLEPSRRQAAAAVPALADVPAFCRVAATLTPTKESDIKIEVWLPAAGWNGKLQAVGNGGWNGNIDTNALAGAVRRGYAGTSTDTGHQGGAGPWMQNTEKLTDWAHRSIHETAVAAKALINAFYGEAPKFSYFTGCSAGGRQAMVAAQRYPADFDGVVAGSPGLDWTSRAVSAVRVNQAFERDPRGACPLTKFAGDQRRGHEQVRCARRRQGRRPRKPEGVHVRSGGARVQRARPTTPA